MRKKNAVWILVGVAVVGAFAWRTLRTKEEGPAEAPPKVAARAEKPMIRMVELGSDECASCRAMIPVLEELRSDFGDQLRVDFIDVWKYPKKAEPFGVRVIPTQVFLGPDGKELARHEGFYPVKGIRKRWADLGFDLETKGEGSKEEKSHAERKQGAR